MDFDFLQSFSSLSLYVTNKVVASNALQKMLNLIFQNFRQKKPQQRTLIIAQLKRISQVLVQYYF